MSKLQQSTVQLTDLMRVARLMADYAREVEALTEALKSAKERHRAFEQEVVPGLMAELGVSSVTLDTGEILSCKPDIFVSVSEDKRELANAWIEDHGGADIVKAALSVDLGRGFDPEALQAIRDHLIEFGLVPSVKTGVHPATLKKFMRELVIEQGLEPPARIMNTQLVMVASLKQPSATKR